jgi:hypothetical protein
MQTTTAKRFTLPFSPQKTSSAEVEAAAVFAVAEYERSKGGGLITRQPQEKLTALSKIGYPLWLFSKNESTFLFDGFGDTNYSVAYVEVPSADAFIESLEENSRPREKYTTFLSDHSNYFQQSIKEKQFNFRGLIADLDFRKEFSMYRKEATEATAQSNGALLSPTLEEYAISSMLTEFDKLKAFLLDEVEKLHECTKQVNAATSQYITELDYEAGAVKDEAEAKIRAQEELVNPKVAKINKDYKTKIKNLTARFDQEIESLQKLKAKTQKLVESNEGKISLYQREAKAQTEKKHAIYARRWKEKVKQAKKEQSGFKKELKSLENNIKRLDKQRGQEISELNFGLDEEIKVARQPLLELEASRDAKLLAFKLEIEKLVKQEKPVVDGLNKSLKLREPINASFEDLGIEGQVLKNQGLFYVPFYAACFEMGLSRRYLLIPPSTINGVDFSAKLKSAFGMSKIKDVFTPRFNTIAELIEKTHELTKQNTVFESQLYGLMQKNNLLNNGAFMENVAKGLVYLKHEGWLSEKEHQVLTNRMTA